MPSAAKAQCEHEQPHNPTTIVVAPGLALPALRPEAATVTIQLEATANPLRTITEALEERRQQGTPAKELHLLAHANSQGIQLADQWIDQATLLRHASELAHWQISTVVLWCCQIGRNQDFIDLFKEVTGAEVFASQNSINKEAIKTTNQDGGTRQLSELIENSQLHTWQGDLAWIQIDDEIEGRISGARCGDSVSLSADGSVLAVGSWGDRTRSKNQGSVATYTLDNNNEWEEIEIIDGGRKQDFFGAEVSLSDDGTRLAIGAPRDDDGGNLSGTASIYELTGGSWVRLGDPIPGVTGVRLGAQLALSGDGSTVIVGAIKHNSGRGYAGIYTWNGTSWARIGNNIKGTQRKEYCGSSVAISQDGTRIAIGSPGYDSSKNDMGRIRVYDKTGSNWSLKFTIVGAVKGDKAGSSISLSDDGNIIAIGAPKHSKSKGHVRVYDISGSSKVRLGADIDGNAAGQQFGGSVSLSANGQRVAIGAQWADGVVGDNAGRIRIYDYQSSSNTWSKVGSNLEGESAGDRASGAVGGSGISLSGDGQSVAIGSQFHDGSAGKDSGYAKVFAASGLTITQTGTTDGSGNLLTTETGNTSTFTVVLDAQPTANVTVALTGDDDSEHALSASSLTFTADNWDTAQTVTVTGADDSLVDGDITTTLTATASNAGGYAGTETATTTVITTDDDTAGITITQTGSTDGSGNLLTTEDGDSSTFTVELDSEPTADVSVSLTGTDSSEHLLSHSSLTFTADNWDTAQTITVTGIDDTTLDGDITTTLTATASNTGGYDGNEEATTTVITTDNETAGITITQTGITDGSGNLLTTEDSGSSTFTVVLDAKPTANVTVSLSGDDDSEHTLSHSSLTFTADNWDTPQTITVTGVDDDVDDGDITTTLTATASNTGGYDGSEEASTTVITTDDDSAGITITQTGSTDGSGNLLTAEDGDSSTFTVVLDAKPTANVTVSLSGDDDSEHTLSHSSLTFTADNWDTPQTITVTGVDDDVVDGDSITTLTATASDTGGYDGSEEASTTVITTDNETAGITIGGNGSKDDSGNLLTSEGGGSSIFTVELDAQPTANVTVTLSGDDDSEHWLSHSELTFTADNWDTYQTVTVTGIDDDLDDGDIITTLTATASNTGGYVGETATTTVITTDDDSSGIVIVQTGSTDGSGNLLTTEAGDSSTFSVVLEIQPSENVTVSISGDDGSEHTLSHTSLTFTADNWETPQTVTVTGVNDDVDDGDIITTLTATASNTGGFDGSEEASTTVITTDDDSAGITITQTGSTDGSGNLLTTEDGDSSTFTVELDSEPTADVSVSLSGDDGSEHTLNTSSLTFTADNWDTPQTITVTGVDDDVVDGDSITTLTATASNTGGYDGSEEASTTVITTDDDNTGITITQTGSTDGSGNLLTTEDGDSSTFTVELNSEPTADVSVSLTGTDSSEYSLSTPSLTFTADNWDTPQTITVTGVDDTTLDGDITTTLTATASNTGGYDGNEEASTAVITTDNETAGITITQTGITDSSGNLLTTEDGDSSTFTVVLDAKPTANVTVSITGDDDTEYSLSDSSLTFSTSNWDTPQTVTVTGVDDTTIDGDITTTLTASASATGGFDGSEEASTTVITTDDDTAGITITQTGTTDGSGNLLTTEAGDSSTFTVVLDVQPTANVTVSLSGADSTEHSLSPSSLTFTADNWNTAQTVSITGVNDSLQDGDITTTLTATASNTGGYAGTETATTTVTNTDNDNPPSISDQSEDVLENISSGSELLDLDDNNSGNDTDQDGDSITYSITDGNDQDLFEIESNTGKILLAAGKSLDHDKSDLHTLEISATDGTLATTAEISIHVIDVNNAPVAEADSESVNENETLNITAASGLIISNDTDEDGDSLVINNFHAGVLNTTSPRIGQFNTALDGDFGQLTLQTDGSFSYTANKSTADALAGGETESDIFSYRVSDGKLTDSTELTITIAGINDAPFMVDATRTRSYEEGVGLVRVIDGSLDIRDVDDINIESATVTIAEFYEESEDELVFDNTADITGSWDSSTGILSLTGSTTTSNYITALESVKYTNTNNDNPTTGPRTIEWVVNDGDDNSTVVSTSLIVGGTNDAPTASNETASVDADDTVSTSTEDNDNLLINDTDPDDGQTLTITSFRQGSEQESNTGFAPGSTLTGSYGQMTIEADGSYSYTAQETAAYKLLDGEIATETFTYTITDGQSEDEGIDTGEITITITGTNDAPTALDDAANVDEDSSKLFADFAGILKNDTDIDGDQLYIKSVHIGAEINRNDFHLNSLSTELEGNFGTLLVNPDGSYRYSAILADALDEGDKETDSFTYTLTDLTHDDSAEIVIQITGVNDAPSLDTIETGIILDLEYSSAITSNNLSGQLTASDPDESAVLTYGINSVSTVTTNRNIANSFSTNLINGTYGQLEVNATTGEYTYTPNSTAVNNLTAGQSATETFSLFVSDGSLTSTQTFDIELTGSADGGPSSDDDSDSSSSDSNSSDTSKASSSLTDSSSFDRNVSSSKTSLVNSNESIIDGFDALIGPFSSEQSTGSVAFSNFWDRADAFQGASNEIGTINTLPIKSTNQGDNAFLKAFASGEGGITQRFATGHFNSIEQSNGIRLMMPNFSNPTWQQDIPASKEGQIPMFVTLLEQPKQATIVQLGVNHSSINLSTNTLAFTPQNWNKAQSVWIDMNDLNPEEANTTIQLDTTLKTGDSLNKAQTESLILTLPNPKACQIEGCATSENQTQQALDSEQSLDLELETVREENSPIFLLIKTTLSPLILLTNMAMHSINQARRIQTETGRTRSQTEEKVQHPAKPSISSNQHLGEASNTYEAIELTSQHNSSHTLPDTTRLPSLTPASATLASTEQDGIGVIW